MKIDVGGKEYSLGYPTRKDAVNAELYGLDVTNAGRILSTIDTLFYTGLIAKQPTITKEEATNLQDQYTKEGGDIEEVAQFLLSEYMAFTKSPEVEKKKKAKIVEM